MVVSPHCFGIDVSIDVRMSLMWALMSDDSVQQETAIAQFQFQLYFKLFHVMYTTLEQCAAACVDTFQEIDSFPSQLGE